MKNSFRLGRLFGIEVAIHYSWFIIFALLLWLLATQLFPSEGWYPGLSSAVYWTMSAVTTLLFFSSVLAHELCHSLVARRRGLPVRSITLFVFGGVSNISREPDTPEMELAVAAAGPGSSFVLGGLFFGIWGVARAAAWPLGIVGVAYYLGLINVVLAGFNLVPGFPLDGGRLLRAIIWKRSGDLEKATRIASNIGRGVGYLIIAYGVFLFIAGFAISGLWFVLIGWFLEQMSSAGYRQTLTRQALDGVKVSEIMTPNPVVVPGSISLQKAVDDYFIRLNHGAFPVVSNGDVTGMVTWRQAKAKAEEWATTSVAEVMLPLEPRIATSPSEQLNSILGCEVMREHGRLLVLDKGKLTGIISRTDVSQFLQEHAAPSDLDLGG
jgi:Zn-dependent protease